MTFESRSASSENRLRTSDSGAGTLIIGYGNPLRSDDALGWRATELIGREVNGQRLEIITCHQLTPELAEPISRCQRTVFIDADAQGTPGEIHCFPVCPQVAGPPTLTHTCTPEGLLASAQQLYGRFPQAIAITVSAQSFEFGDALSPVVAEALPKVVDRVREWLHGGDAAGL